MSRNFKLHLFLLGLICFITSPTASSATTDPVTDFIIKADSLVRAGGDEALAPYVGERAVLVGAAVGQLLDVAFEIGEAGDRQAEKENVEFAERLARLHETRTGSRVPLELVEIYRGWTPEQRATRARAKALEAEAFGVRDEGDYDLASERFHQVIELCQTIDDRRTIAITWGSLGVVHWYRGDLEANTESYNNALTARRAIEDRILEGRTLNGLGSINFRAGDYEKAVEYYDKAAVLRRETGDFGALGISLTYKGNMYYQMARLGEARETLDEAYAVLEEYGSPAQMIEVLNSIASIYSDMGRLSSANDTYRRAIDIASAVDRPQDEASCRINLADNLCKQGHFRDALQQLGAVPGLLDRQPEPEKTVVFYNTRGHAYMMMGELDAARDDLLAGLDHAKQLDDPYYQIETRLMLARLYNVVGAYEQGLAIANEAQALTEDSVYTRQLTIAYVLAAAAEMNMGHYEEALRYRELSLEKNRLDGRRENVLEDEIAMATYRALLGDTDEARETLYEALPRAEELERKDLGWHARFCIGHTFERELPDSAAHYYEEALSLLEESRSDIGGAELRTGFLAGERRFAYEEVARYFASLNGGNEGGDWSARAFLTIERAKARGLLDLLERSVLTGTSPAEEAVLDSVYALSGDTATETEKQRQLEGRYIELRDKRFAESVGKMTAGGGVARVEDVRKTLPRKTALLEYALGDTVSLLWVIDRKGHEIYEIPNRAALRPSVERLRDAIRRPGPGDAALRETARSLYESLVSPAENRLRGADRLVIVPDGFLFEIPFDVLLTAEPDPEADWGDLPYIARSFDTVYSPSASILVKMTESRKKGRYDIDLLAFGDPDFSLLGEGAELDDLPYSRVEVEKISAPLKEDRKRVFLGAEASESNVKLALGEGSPRVIHLATHGLADAVDPVSSSVVFAPDSVAGEDGYLYTLEILSLPIDAGLVVLSACESARGRVDRGEGVVGLSRAFIAAGSRGVVASLWAVSDESTAELMTVFYQKMLGKKKPAPEALNAARLSLLENPDYAHPFHWSPFVVIGAGKMPW